MTELNGRSHQEQAIARIDDLLAMQARDVSEMIERAYNGEPIWIPRDVDPNSTGTVIDYWEKGQPQGFLEELGFDGYGWDAYLSASDGFHILTKDQPVAYADAASILLKAVQDRSA